MQGLSLLIIDDMAANAESLATLLQLEGAMTTVATSGLAAVELAQRQRFDVIISDLGMPGMSGYEMMRAIANTEINATTPAIAYSGYGGPDDVQKSVDAGFSLHLTKPANLEQLIAAITTVRQTVPGS